MLILNIDQKHSLSGEGYVPMRSSPVTSFDEAIRIVPEFFKKVIGDVGSFQSPPLDRSIMPRVNGRFATIPPREGEHFFRPSRAIVFGTITAAGVTLYPMVTRSPVGCTSWCLVGIEGDAEKTITGGLRNRRLLTLGRDANTLVDISGQWKRDFDPKGIDGYLFYDSDTHPLTTTPLKMKDYTTIVEECRKQYDIIAASMTGASNKKRKAEESAINTALQVGALQSVVADNAVQHDLLKVKLKEKEHDIEVLKGALDLRDKNSKADNAEFWAMKEKLGARIIELEDDLKGELKEVEIHKKWWYEAVEKIEPMRREVANLNESVERLKGDVIELEGELVNEKEMAIRNHKNMVLTTEANMKLQEEITGRNNPGLEALTRELDDKIEEADINWKLFKDEQKAKEKLKEQTTSVFSAAEAARACIEVVGMAIIQPYRSNIDAVVEAAHVSKDGFKSLAIAMKLINVKKIKPGFFEDVVGPRLREWSAACPKRSISIGTMVTISYETVDTDEKTDGVASREYVWYQGIILRKTSPTKYIVFFFDDGTHGEFCLDAHHHASDTIPQNENLWDYFYLQE